MSAALTKLRQAGFRVRVVGDSLGITPAEHLSDAQLQWLNTNKLALLDALRVEPAANQYSAVDRHCVDCAHDVRSVHSPTGGLTYCKARRDVPMKLPGARFENCMLFAEVTA